MIKENKHTNSQNIINYLNTEISNYEEKIEFQKKFAKDDKKNFFKSVLIITSFLIFGIGVAVLFSNTPIMIPALIIATPFTSTGFIGLPLLIISEMLEIKDRKKNLKKYRNLLDSAKKRKQYETKLLESSSTKQSLNLDEMVSSLISDNNQIQINYSKERNKRLESLLTDDKNKKKALLEKDQKDLSKPKDKNQQQGLSYDEEWILRKEIETYANAFNRLLQAKQKGRLAEFLENNYNITDQETIAMYDALLEEETKQITTSSESENSSVAQWQKKKC